MTSTMKHRPLYMAIGIAVSCFAAPSIAQDQTTTPTTLDRIEVTGSRIRQVDIETAQPVLTISREDIDNQGFQSVADILQNITAAGSPPLSRASPLATGEAPGGLAIDLRNLGAQRTLVLVNGKRLGITTNGVQDISTIPAAMVERIEVLKDGASAIYGSDAMAGVVNIITRSNYSGLQASAYYGEQSEGDGEIETIDLVLGASDGRGSITAGVEYSKEGEVWERDRPFSAYPQGPYHPTVGWTPVGQYGGFVSSPTVNTIPGFVYPPATEKNPTRSVRVIVRPGGNPRNPADYIAQDMGTNNTTHKSNANEQMHLRTPLERKSVFVDGSYDLNDSIRFRANMLYSNRVAVRTAAGYPMQAASWGDFDGGAGVPLHADSYFNPIGTDIGNWWRRSWEVPRTSTSEANTWRFSAALEGSFEVGPRYFDWDVATMYNRNDVLQSSHGNFTLANLQKAVGPSFMNESGRVQCGTPDDPIPFADCIPWNPLLHHGESGHGSLADKDLQDFLFQTTHSRGETETTIYTANLTGGLFTLPAGESSFAVGVERRKEEGRFVPDALLITGGSSSNAARPTGGSYTEESIYGELFIPILMGQAAADELSVSVSTRYSDYDTFGDTTNSKLGIKWKPIEDLLVRATWAQGFRAPTIANLYGGGTQNFAFFTDPCDTLFGAAASDAAVRARCGRDISIPETFRQLRQGFVPAETEGEQTPLPFFSGAGNPNLTPEESISRNLGFVWSPGFVEGLSLSADWWEVEIDNTIVLDNPTQMLDDCYIHDIASRCEGFTRDAVLGIVNYMEFGNRNAGFVEMEGFDVGLSYGVDSRFGRLSADWQNTYTSRNEFKTDDDAEKLNRLNGFFGNFRIRSNLNLGWEKGDFSANWVMRYHSSMKDQCFNATTAPEECSYPKGGEHQPGQPTNINRYGSNTFNDVQLRWKTPWNSTVAIGANNVFDHHGPIMYSQPNSNTTYYGGFDIGRFVYMRYQQKF